jgi:hypothetical protein
MLPAISLHGVLYLEVCEKSITSDIFYDFIDGLLDHMNPFPQPNSVILMDNASIHKSVELQHLIEARCVSHCIYVHCG